MAKIDTLSWKATINTNNIIEAAIRSASIYGESGITRHGSLVTTTECVVYQMKEDKLLLRFRKMKFTGRIEITHYSKEKT